MNVIFVGDIVGPEATEYLAGRLPDLRHEHRVDLVVANAENCAIVGDSPVSGTGMTLELIDLLLESGVDVISGGNHSWYGPDFKQVLQNPQVIRPYNMPSGTSGRGLLTVQVDGEPVSVLNWAGESAIPEALPAYSAWLSAQIEGTSIVDFHGDSAGEKTTFAFAIDGKAAAVLGTHTHEPTLLLHRLPGGTALVSDVGMTGPLGGYGGVDPAHPLAELKGEDPNGLRQFTTAPGPMILGAVLLRIESGKTLDISRLS